ncbi:TolC family outer membrane protein [Cupriavidus pauculus]|uniref:TolC family outer membrane protein n=1 Tax=Cupriavidus pauculus TaxID=82633 RepID=UPI00203CEE0C|nr:TolC family outer membrane protein [Cupriavidus pauculus]MCM3607902.1 TolC family outer membrane protein [Cupriavidus pauculus]
MIVMKSLKMAPRAAQVALACMLCLSAAESSAMDLVGAYEQALAHDPTTLAANDALAAGQEKAVQGRALLLPSLRLQGGVGRAVVHSSAADDGASLIPPNTSGTVRQAGVVLVQPIYDRGAVAAKKQLREQTSLAQTQFGQSRQDLALRVAEAYFGVVLGEETLRVVQAEKAALRQQRDRAKARFDIGQGKITDLQEAQARLDGVESREVTAQSVLEQRRSRFQEIVGTSPDQLSGLAARFAPRPPEPDNLAAWQAKGEEQSFLVKTRQSELDIAGAEIDKYRLASRPTVSLVAGYSSQGQTGNLAPWVAANTRSATVGLQVNIPLYAGGGLDSRERESVAKKSQAEQELAAARRDVRLNVQDGFLSVKTGVSRISALEQSLTSARSALAATILGRDVGTRTEPDVLDAQQRVFAAELDVVQARLDYLLGRLRLAAAAGELSEDTLRSLNDWLAS